MAKDPRFQMKHCQLVFLELFCGFEDYFVTFLSRNLKFNGFYYSFHMIILVCQACTNILFYFNFFSPWKFVG